MSLIMKPGVSKAGVDTWHDGNKLVLEALIRDAKLVVRHGSAFDVPCDFEASIEICCWLCSLKTTQVDNPASCASVISKARALDDLHDNGDAKSSVVAWKEFRQSSDVASEQGSFLSALFQTSASQESVSKLAIQ